jgi:CRISPR/Cas system CMR-associated protein Cmr5 small subunit
MPVIPHGIPPYTIRPPLTTDDDGKPTSSIAKDAHRVLDLIEDERHLTALALFESVRERINEWKHMTEKKQHQHKHHKHLKSIFHVKHKESPAKQKTEHEMKSVIDLFDSKEEVLHKLEVRTCV